LPEVATGTVLGARDHARAQAGARAATQPTVPVSLATDLPPGVEPASLLWDETVGLGGYATRVLPRGAHLRLADLEGDTNVSLVLHNARRPSERLNVADTVKLQWSAYPGVGSLLLSDLGRVLATVVDGDIDSIDVLCGALPPAVAEARYGGTGNHSLTPSGRDRLVLGLAKHDLTRRDLPPAANLFRSVRVAPDGSITLIEGASHAGAHLTLRAELAVLVTLAVTPHPLDDRPSYSGGPVRLTAWRGEPSSADDPLRRTSPEATRAFENTDEALLEALR
jgi:urea carboxylase-associated protein 2